MAVGRNVDRRVDPRFVVGIRRADEMERSGVERASTSATADGRTVRRRIVK